MDVRAPIAAGRFYEADADALTRSIENCYSHSLGPKKQELENIKAALVPHAGYIFSGPCAAHVYSTIKKPDVFVVLGPNHTGVGSDVATSTGIWETPLGRCEIDNRFAELLDIPIDQDAHRYEHSIEVQLPFLQHKFKEFSFVPICISDCEPRRIAKKIIVASEDRKVVVLASSDLTHYGQIYHYTPFRENVKENMRKMDSEILDYITSVDPAGFSEHMTSDEFTVCGWKPRAVMLEWAKIVSCTHGKLLKYYTSADIIDDYASAVGYASVVIT
jgi:AmmeMemoRadiSam system protein B